MDRPFIEIRVVARGGRPWHDESVTRFDDSGGAIGRGVDCRLRLEDPDRRISRRQASVHYRDGRFLLRQLSEAGDVDVNDQSLDVDAEIALNAGDRIRIGTYELAIVSAPTVDPETAATGGTEVDPLKWFDASQRPTTNALRELLQPAAVPPASTPQPAGGSVDLPIGDPTELHSRVAAEQQVLVAALLAGLGGGERIDAQLTPALMQRIGTLLRIALQGTLDLLTSRTVAKHEFRGDATLLQRGENNPLKFSPTIEVALDHLLGPTRRGFMPAETALTEAFSDLQAHQAALMTAMREALQAVVSQWDPAVLEAELARDTSGPKAWLPGARKAQLWDRLCAQHAELARRAEAQFEAKFAEAFRAAYRESQGRSQK